MIITRRKALFIPLAPAIIGLARPSAAQLMTTGAGKSPAGGGSFDPFDPAKMGTYGSLSNSNKTLSGNGAGNDWATALALTGRSSGKYGFRLRVDALTVGGMMAGLAVAYGGGEGYVDYFLSQWGPAFGLQNEGTQRLASFTAGVSQYTAVAAAGDAWLIIADMDAGKIWVAAETSGHSGFDNGGNPTTGANPFLTFTAGATFYPAATIWASPAGGNTVTLLTGSDVGTLPSGVSAW